jgi:hypothetical protein
MGEPDQAVEVVPLVVHAQVFAARPSSLPDIRDFVRRRLAQTQFSEDDLRTLGECVSGLLLEAAGTGGTIQVSLRTFSGSAEIDVIHSDEIVDIGHTGTRSVPAGATAAQPVTAVQPGIAARPLGIAAAPPGIAATLPGIAAAPPGIAAAPPEIAAAPPGIAAATIRPEVRERAPASFPAWLASALRNEGMTMEAASRRLGVSVKTVSRWIAGTTEPRWRDLSRMREIFGTLPF